MNPVKEVPIVIPSDPVVSHNAIGALVQYYAETIGALREKCLRQQQQIDMLGHALKAATKGQDDAVSIPGGSE
jgi:hypothetical protein